MQELHHRRTASLLNIPPNILVVKQRYCPESFVSLARLTIKPPPTELSRESRSVSISVPFQSHLWKKERNSLSLLRPKEGIKLSVQNLTALPVTKEDSYSKMPCAGAHYFGKALDGGVPQGVPDKS